MKIEGGQVLALRRRFFALDQSGWARYKFWLRAFTGSAKSGSRALLRR